MIHKFTGNGSILSSIVAKETTNITERFAKLTSNLTKVAAYTAVYHKFVCNFSHSSVLSINPLRVFQIFLRLAFDLCLTNSLVSGRALDTLSQLLPFFSEYLSGHLLRKILMKNFLQEF